MKSFLKSAPANSSLSLSAFSPFGTPSAQAAAIYWDTNGTTAGAGATPTGTWDNGGAANWNTNSAGTTNLGAVWTNSLTTNTSVFSAGTDAVNPYTVTVSGTVQTAGITVEDGNLTGPAQARLPSRSARPVLRLPIRSRVPPRWIPRSARSRWLARKAGPIAALKPSTSTAVSARTAPAGL